MSEVLGASESYAAEISSKHTLKFASPSIIKNMSNSEFVLLPFILQSHEKNFKFTCDTSNLQVSDVQTVDGQ